MGQQSLRNMRALAHHDLAGSGSCGEGTVLLERGGRRYLYIAHVDIQASFSILDVSDPRAPELLFQDFLPHRIDHGKRSPTVGYLAPGDEMSPMTSTGTV